MFAIGMMLVILPLETVTVIIGTPIVLLFMSYFLCHRIVKMIKHFLER